MPAPLIGVTIHPTSSPDRAELDLLVAEIVASVERAGGLPVLLPLGLSDGSARALFERLDGVLFSGGGDIDPQVYGAETTPLVGGVDAERDRSELRLARWVAAAHRPCLCICRGVQLLNVAMGGTLYRDVLTEHPGAERHAWYPDHPYDLRPHPISIAPDSQLARIVGGTQIEVNSLHHQAVQQVAPGLRVVAHAPDGVIEALEIPDHPFAVAVQWHPEVLGAWGEQRALFEAFVSAAANR